MRWSGPAVTASDATRGRARPAQASRAAAAGPDEGLCARDREAERARLSEVFASNPGQWEMRRAAWMLGEDAERRFYSQCDMYSLEDFAAATRMRFDDGRIRDARARSLWQDPAGAGRQQSAISASVVSGTSAAWGSSSCPRGAQYGAYGAQEQRYAWEQAPKRQVGF